MCNTHRAAFHLHGVKCA